MQMWLNSLHLESQWAQAPKRLVSLFLRGAPEAASPRDSEDSSLGTCPWCWRPCHHLPFEPLTQIGLKWLSMKWPPPAIRVEVPLHQKRVDIMGRTKRGTPGVDLCRGIMDFTGTFTRFYRVNVASPHPMSVVLLPSSATSNE
ncbi:unnamed protein product [Boreogadus saida]